MKLKSRPLPKPEEKSVLEQQAETLEQKVVRLAEEIAELENRSINFRAITDAAIRERARSFIDLLDRRMADAERRVAYNILEFLDNSPFWELKKISENLHSRNDASHTFAKAIREGWRYIGSYMNPDANAIPRERYTLMIRPKGGPITDSEYLKLYEEFLDRKDLAELEERKKKAEAYKKTLSQPAAKTDTKSETKSKPKAQLKIQPKGKK